MRQSDNVSPARKASNDSSLHVKKLKDLSQYISIIGSKETQFQRLTEGWTGAEELFAPGAEIGMYQPSIKNDTLFK